LDVQLAATTAVYKVLMYLINTTMDSDSPSYSSQLNPEFLSTPNAVCCIS